MPGKLTSAWEIEKRITFESTGGPAKLIAVVPSSNEHFEILSEGITAPGYGISRSKKRGNRLLTLAKRKAEGKQSVYLRFVISLQESPEKKEEIPTPKTPGHDLNEAQMAAALELLRISEEKSSDLETFVATLLNSLSDKATTDKIVDPSINKASPVRKVDAAVQVLAVEGIPARRVSGIDLGSARQDAGFVYWLEVFRNGKWHTFSQNGELDGVPPTYLPWSRGAMPNTELSGGRDSKTTINTIRLEQHELVMALEKGSAAQDPLIKFSLFSLPLETQKVYRILMVVPLGVFLLVVMRNMIGIRGLGTFMPVLIALAFRETQLLWGIILFSTVVATGLLFRAYLEQLKLLLVPRLASVLIFVVLLMALLSVITHALGFQRGLSVALFPMVIMSMTIERVSVIWDERGAREALMQAAGGLAMATLCYLVMTIPSVEHLFFTFPELLLVLLALTLLIGRYTGYRLLELHRFRELATEKQ